MLLGVSMLLDIHNMEGDISYYMSHNIANSDRVLLICTPRLADRANQPVVNSKPNNLQVELEEALKKQQHLPKFIIPLVLEGDHRSSVPQQIKHILALNMSDESKYCEMMTSLSPKGIAQK